jgi:hypothetical protein
MAEDPVAAAVSLFLLNVMVELFRIAHHYDKGVGDLHALTEVAAIRAAQQYLREQGLDSNNASLIALYTGLNRSMITERLKVGLEVVRDKPFKKPTAQVVRAWKSLDGYCDRDGSAKILPIRGPAPSFSALVRATLGQDLAPKQILQELRRQKAVENVAHRQVRLIRSTVGDESDIGKLLGFGLECDVLRAQFELLRRGEPVPYFRHIVGTNLDPEQAAIFQTSLTKSTQATLNTMEKRLAEESNATKDPSAQTHRFGAALVIVRTPEIEQSGTATHPVSEKGSRRKGSNKILRRSQEGAAGRLRER